jgi:hypothetical protein
MDKYKGLYKKYKRLYLKVKQSGGVQVVGGDTPVLDYRLPTPHYSGDVRRTHGFPATFFDGLIREDTKNPQYPYKGVATGTVQPADALLNYIETAYAIVTYFLDKPIPLTSTPVRIGDLIRRNDRVILIDFANMIRDKNFFLYFYLLNDFRYTDVQRSFVRDTQLVSNLYFGDYAKQFVPFFERNFFKWNESERVCAVIVVQSNRVWVKYQHLPNIDLFFIFTDCHVADGRCMDRFSTDETDDCVLVTLYRHFKANGIRAEVLSGDHYFWNDTGLSRYYGFGDSIQKARVDPDYTSGRFRIIPNDPGDHRLITPFSDRGFQVATIFRDWTSPFNQGSPIIPNLDFKLATYPGTRTGFGEWPPPPLATDALAALSAPPTMDARLGVAST